MSEAPRDHCGLSSPFLTFSVTLNGPVVIAEEGIDALHARAVAAGAEIVEGPVDRDYGSRDYIAGDSEGRLWAFGCAPGAPRAGG